jgi:hypothetical protein
MNAPQAIMSRLKATVSHKPQIIKLSIIALAPAGAQPAAPVASVHDGRDERQMDGYSGKSMILSRHSV